MAKQKSRSARWFEAVGNCRDKFTEIDTLADDLAGYLSDLQEIQSEYEDWQGNLPENLQSSALAEKLSEVTELEIETAANEPLSNWDTVIEVLDAAENIELPQGFGRD